MFESMYKDFETFMAAEEIYLGQCSSSEDFKEGITAFLENAPRTSRENNNYTTPFYKNKNSCRSRNTADNFCQPATGYQLTANRL